MNINTQDYWDKRFRSGDWEMKSGRMQTVQFALSLIPKLKITRDFQGVIVDFGCGLGDAIPVYHSHFPAAKLIGIDISSEAIKLCQIKYGSIAKFYQGEHIDVLMSDIIIASNVMEHITNDLDVVDHLVKKCKQLYITVPYKEKTIQNSEHVNSYDEHYYDSINPCGWFVFTTKGWSQYGFKLLFDVYLRNIFRILEGKETVCRSKQIMFHFSTDVL